MSPVIHNYQELNKNQETNLISYCHVTILWAGFFSVLIWEGLLYRQDSVKISSTQGFAVKNQIIFFTEVCLTMSFKRHSQHHSSTCKHNSQTLTACVFLVVLFHFYFFYLVLYQENQPVIPISMNIPRGSKNQTQNKTAKNCPWNKGNNNVQTT